MAGRKRRTAEKQAKTAKRMASYKEGRGSSKYAKKGGKYKYSPAYQEWFAKVRRSIGATV